MEARGASQIRGGPEPVVLPAEQGPRGLWGGGPGRAGRGGKMEGRAGFKLGTSPLMEAVGAGRGRGLSGSCFPPGRLGPTACACGTGPSAPGAEMKLVWSRASASLGGAFSSRAGLGRAAKRSAGL